MTPADAASELFEVLLDRGHRQYGERVTELQHALQCATLAHESGEEAEVVAACLLHDYGHLLHDLGEDVAARGLDARHEQVGANRLSGLFPESVVAPIRMHADSKRYLCFREAGYLNGLSEASRRSLALQGGTMTSQEAETFEADPHFDRAIRVRRYDDRGKVADRTTPSLESFRGLLESLVLARG